MRQNLKLNTKNQNTLKAIFDTKTRPDIKWADIERLLKACNAEITEGKGSRVRFCLNGRKGTIHRPHPKDITDKGAVKYIRKFLVSAGVNSPVEKTKTE